MREILFRGKMIDTNKWIIGYFAIGQSDGLSYIIPINNSYESAKVVYDETVGQYTGLQDKNGNKIFEGDILELYDQFIKYRGIVEFRHSAFIIKYGNRMTTLYEIERQNHFNSGLWNLNVIGNIYDNHELLEAK